MEILKESKSITLLLLTCALVCSKTGQALAQNVAPVITAQPQTDEVTIGYTAIFTVSIKYQYPFPNVQWLKNNSPIAGATNASFFNSGPSISVTYSITNVSTNDAGRYSVVMSNSFGVVTSSNATLSVLLTPYTFITMAGVASTAGTNDGQGNAARFNGPTHGAMDSQGNLLLTDISNSSIRKVTPEGVVTTLETHDGAGNPVTLISLHRIAIDSSNNIFVSLLTNDIVVEITPDGVATTIAGMAGVAGTNDGVGSDARFNGPEGVALDASGNLFVSDNNSDIREISPMGTNWVVTTIAGGSSPGRNDGTNRQAHFDVPEGLAVDASSNIFVADWGNCMVRKITPVGTNWVVTTPAGNGLQGSVDGFGAYASFGFPNGIALGPDGEIYVTDSFLNKIRRMTLEGTNWFVRTIAGVPGVPSVGTNDGTGSAAGFGFPNDVRVDNWGNLLVLDSDNNRVQKGWVAGTAPVTYLNPPVATPGQVQLDFRIVTGAPTNFTLFQADQLSGPWYNNPGAILTTNVPGLSYLFTFPLSNNISEFYRLQQQ